QRCLQRYAPRDWREARDRGADASRGSASARSACSARRLRARCRPRDDRGGGSAPAQAGRPAGGALGSRRRLERARCEERLGAQREEVDRPRPQAAEGRRQVAIRARGRLLLQRSRPRAPNGYGRLMIPGLLERVDCVVGDSIERAMSAHHRRRLRKVGWEHALLANDASWAVGGEPPSTGNAIEVLVDGEEALPRMAEAIAGARSHVHIAGWCVTPDFALTADEPPVILHDLLADAARRVPVRVLLWGGAPLPMYPVSRRAVRSVRDALCKDSAIVCALDTH